MGAVVRWPGIFRVGLNAFIQIYIIGPLLQVPTVQGLAFTPIPCYNNTRAQKCVPEFGNVAFDIPMDATNTCGVNGRTDFCTQTKTTKNYCGSCYHPDNREGLPSYPARYLTDLHNENNKTWWQSETMLEGIQYPNQVNLTLHLRKAYDITYVRLLFYSPRPDSFAIYKRTSEDGPWIPYQYYSSTCRDTYGLDETTSAVSGDDARAFCTSEFSFVSPLTGGSVPFSTLEGRPSAYKFEVSPQLKEWVTATDIRITLDRLNTFGDHHWREAVVLKSYFYAVMDIAVGARCKCNGHASDCPLVGPGWKRVCRCEHYTDGEDCEKCLPFYNDAPWSRATEENAHECKPCNCNGFSNRCFFDKELYDITGHGGHCLDCQGNRAGPNCERCRDNFFQVEGNYCVDCNCNEIGSRNKQCNAEGKCPCKPGVTGDKCDRCEANHFNFGPDGCAPCGCSVAGSQFNTPHCNPETGTCLCKENVEGKRCQDCKPGFFNLDLENQYGCTPCFCYGQSSICTSAVGHSKVVLESNFARGSDKWSAEDENHRPMPLRYYNVSEGVGVISQGNEPVYFLAPGKFLGDQRGSYNQDIEFKLRVGEATPRLSDRDLIIEGASLSITQPIYGQNNSLPSFANQKYKFRLHEHGEHGWQPRLSAKDFMSVLSDVKAIKIRGTYANRSTGFLDDFKLHTARLGAAGAPAKWIEMCSCPPGYVGQYCESCEYKYRHEPANGGPFARCVPCNCNKHADSCEADSGRCICQHNTEGENCERCARGFYGNSLQGTPNDCKPCPCPDGGACIELDNDEVVCTECPKGYSGHRCDICSDGFFGDPTGKFGPTKPCLPCDCNNNVDSNAVGNCNRTTGVCLKCIYNTAGSQCDQCLNGFFGDALAIPKGDCKPCQCYRVGTQQSDSGPPLCDQLTGRCHCKPNVTGANCDACATSYYNILSGEGCESCECDSIGALNKTCDLMSGQCYCRPGVTGRKCDQCEPYHYGFSIEGCKPCDCDDIGSSGHQCDANGQCPCRENVEGRRCDRCKENKFDRQRGCVDCPACYSLVQDAANDYRKELAELQKLLHDIANNPTVIDDNDTDFEKKLAEVQARVQDLVTRAKYGIGGGSSELLKTLNDLNNQLSLIDEELHKTEQQRRQAELLVGYGASNVSMAEDSMEGVRAHLTLAMEHLRTKGLEALQRAFNRSDQFGQQNKRMSEISQEARLLAADHEKEAKQIKDIADKAENISMEAYDIISNAVKKQQFIKDEVDVLRSEIAEVEMKVDASKRLAAEALDAATKSLNDAVEVYQEIESLAIPDSPAARLKEEAETLTKEARKTAEEAELLLNEEADRWQELEILLEQSEELLRRGEEQQFLANKLLADVDVAKKKAEAAVKKGHDTISEAENTVVLLSGFEKNVQDSKDRATKAKETLPYIRKLIDEALEKTATAENALRGAEMNAQRARDTAQDAQINYAEKASKDASSIRKEAEETKSKAAKLRDEADFLAGKVAVTGTKLADMEDQAKENEDKIATAKQKVGLTKNSVADTAKVVETAMDAVNSIINELQVIPHFDENDLEELERRLDEAERTIKESGVDEHIQILKDEKFSQTQLLNQYQAEVDKLREEVANIELISKTLPDGCFKLRQSLELP